MTTPAIAGGQPAKTKPFGKAKNRYGEEELKELREAIEQGTLFYAQGKKVHQLEAEFAKAHGAKYAVACSSCTAAIHTAFMAVGISPGDEVIVTAITDMGSILPILWQGGVPVFADLDPETYNLDPASVEANITPKTKAILAVHLAGNACDLNALKAIADKNNLHLIEDCAQSHGATYQGKALGTFGKIGCYSFNEFKHISCGDGGVIITDDEKLATRCRLATDKCYNRAAGASHQIRQAFFLADNYRMTELQGAVALAQLRKLPSIVSRRREWVGQFHERIAKLPGLIFPKVTAGCDSSWWYYMIRVKPELGGNADQFAKALAAEGLPAAAHYIVDPVYTYPLFKNHSAFDHATHPFAAREYKKGICPTAEAILDTCVIFYINEGYTAEDLDQSVEALEKVTHYFASKRSA